MALHRDQSVVPRLQEVHLLLVVLHQDQPAAPLRLLVEDLHLPHLLVEGLHLPHLLVEGLHLLEDLHPLLVILLQQPPLLSFPLPLENLLPEFAPAVVPEVVEVVVELEQLQELEVKHLKLCHNWLEFVLHLK